MPQCNFTLVDISAESTPYEVPLWSGGLTFNSLLFVISIASTAIAVGFSVFSIFSHAVHGSRPWEQRCVIRILFMVPTYAVVSLLSVKFPLLSVYFKVISDFYATVAVSAFFSLLSFYVEPTLHAQKDFFRRLEPKPWKNNFPVPVALLTKFTGGERGPFRTPKSGLTWFNIVSFGVFQYPIILVMTAVITMVTEAKGRYCATNNSPLFAHVWMTIFAPLSATTAGYFLEQYHDQLKDGFPQHKTTLKKWCFKLVITFSTYQTLIMSVLTASWEPHFISTVIAPSPKVTFLDLTVALPSAVLCVELAIISAVHLWAFSYKTYDLRNVAEPGATTYQGGTLGWRMVLSALNPWDQVRLIARTFRWILVGRSHRQEDVSYMRTAHRDSHEFGGPKRDSSLTPGVGGDDDGFELYHSHSSPYGGGGYASPGLRTENPYGLGPTEEAERPYGQDPTENIERPYGRRSDDWW